MRAVAGERVPSEVHHATLARIRQETKRLGRSTAPNGPEDIGTLAALAYPDRIGLRRKGDAARFVLSGGKGAVIAGGDPMAVARLIVATDLDGDPREARVRQGTPLSETALRATFADQIAWHDHCVWSRREGRVETRRQERFGSLVLDDRTWSDAPQEIVARAVLEGVMQLGLRPDKAAARVLRRAALLAGQPDFPDFSEPHLLATLEDWLLPHLGTTRSTADWKRFDMLPALRGRLDWDQQQQMDRTAPAHFETPLGRKIAINYDGETPQIAVRLQEMFGVTRHPSVAGQPLQVTLLSPAQRPVQVTMDLPGFWDGSYADVRKDMRSQYPRHPWPDDPWSATATHRAKPRGT